MIAVLDLVSTHNLQNNGHNEREIRVYYAADDHGNATIRHGNDRRFYIQNEEDQCFAILILIIFIYVVTSVSIILALVINSFISE